MIRNYFKTMFRNLLKRKAFTVINLLGLSTGMAVCLLLALYIENELGWDNFNQNNGQIYRLQLERKYTSRTNLRGLLPQSIGQAIVKEFPEVLQSVRVMDIARGSTEVNIGDKVFQEEEDEMLAVDSNFFHVFAGDFVKGNKADALLYPSTVVLTQSVAKRLFGSDENAFGNTLQVGNRKYQVKGICKDWPAKTHLRFNMLVSMATFDGMNKPDYYDLSTYNYVLLNKNASAKTLEAKLPLIVEKYVAPTIQQGFGETYQQFIAEGNGYRYYLQPVEELHLHSNVMDEMRPAGDINAVYLFTAIAGFILFLACINFINLSTTVSLERARELGIRKTFGSQKASLVWQFLLESVFFGIISMVLAAVIAWLCLPVLNNIAGEQLSFSVFLSPPAILVVLGIAVLTGVVAGIYPAMVLSSFRPILVLKGRLKSGGHGMALRNALVVFQFAVSVILIICAWVVNSQMQYMLGGKLGFNQDNVVDIRQAYFVRDDNNGKPFIDKLRTIAGVEDITQCSLVPGENENNIANCAMQVAGTNVQRTQKTIFTDDRYASVLGLKVVQGRYLSKQFATDSFAMVLNEAAVKDFGLKTPIGAHITSTEPNFNNPDGTTVIYTVVGVVKDYHFESLHKQISPLVITNSNRFRWGTLAVKVKGENFKASLDAILSTWKSFVPKHDIKFDFLDRALAMQYNAEIAVQRLFTVFSLLAIFIACIGLLGLAAYAAAQRTREIGIRKVLGATTGTIVMILSKDFLRLVVISSLVALPLAWLAMHQWLQGFAYRVDMQWWIFLAASAAAVLVALATISYQAIKAALANPVKALRSE
jgi:putative ABC transport system permease protein